MESFNKHTARSALHTGQGSFMLFSFAAQESEAASTFWATTYPSHEIQACYIWGLGGGFTGYGNVVDIVFVGTECMLASR